MLGELGNLDRLDKFYLGSCSVLHPELGGTPVSVEGSINQERKKERKVQTSDYEAYAGFSLSHSCSPLDCCFHAFHTPGMIDATGDQ